MYGTVVLTDMLRYAFSSCNSDLLTVHLTKVEPLSSHRQ